MKEWTKTATAGWVAVVLEEAGIIEIDRKRPMHVMLTMRWECTPPRTKMERSP